MYVIRVLCIAMITHLGSSVLMDSFNQCLVSTPTSIGYCLGIGALSKLQSIDNNPEFDVVDGVTFTRDEQEVRENYNFVNRDPGDFRTVVDSLGQVFSHRSMRWDMSVLYPGLAMRIAPSANPAGVLEFILDPHREAHSQHTVKEASTGRLIARQFLLPFLLGFKFNVATLIPIMFGILALIAKKFFFISKIGLILSSAIGLGSILFKHQQYLNHGGHRPGLGHYGHATYNRYPDEDNNYYADHDSNSNVYNNVQDIYARDDKVTNGKRNFAWNDSEKKEKS